MAVPRAIGKFNKALPNRALIHLAGLGPFVEFEHVGRRSGKVHRTPLMAFRRDDVVVIAMVYGREVDWYRNAVSAGGGRMRMGHEWLTLGRPANLSQTRGLVYVPSAVRPVLLTMRVRDFVEMPILRRDPV